MDKQKSQFIDRGLNQSIEQHIASRSKLNTQSDASKSLNELDKKSKYVNNQYKVHDESDIKNVNEQLTKNKNFTKVNSSNLSNILPKKQALRLYVFLEMNSNDFKSDLCYIKKRFYKDMAEYIADGDIKIIEDIFKTIWKKKFSVSSYLQQLKLRYIINLQQIQRQQQRYKQFLEWKSGQREIYRYEIINQFLFSQLEQNCVVQTTQPIQLKISKSEYNKKLQQNDRVFQFYIDRPDKIRLEAKPQVKQNFTELISTISFLTDLLNQIDLQSMNQSNVNSQPKNLFMNEVNENFLQDEQNQLKNQTINKNQQKNNKFNDLQIKINKNKSSKSNKVHKKNKSLQHKSKSQKHKQISNHLNKLHEAKNPWTYEQLMIFTLFLVVHVEKFQDLNANNRIGIFKGLQKYLPNRNAKQCMNNYLNLTRTHKNGVRNMVNQLIQQNKFQISQMLKLKPKLQQDLDMNKLFFQNESKFKVIADSIRFQKQIITGKNKIEKTSGQITYRFSEKVSTQAIYYI